MSQVSKRVIAVGFTSHSTAANLLCQALSGSAEISFLESAPSHDEIGKGETIILGRDFDFESESSFEAISRAVHNGSNLVIVGPPGAGFPPAWQRLSGVTPFEAKHEGEWFFKVLGSSRLTQRLPGEFAGVGALTLLKVHDDCEPLLATSVAFRDHPTAAVKTFSSSAVCTIGLNPASARISEDLALVIRRAAGTSSRNYSKNSAETLGVGIVGYGTHGGMGYYHGKAVSETAGLNLVAVVDNDANRRKAAEQEFPDVHAYRTLEELAEDGDVDIAIVATPPISHAEISLALLGAGKHVISEKPMCLTTNEAKALITKAKAEDLMLSVNQNRRWDRDFRAIAKAASAGKLGKLFNIETFVGGFEHPCRAWHSEESVSGGAVFDWGSHHIDQIVQLYGSNPVMVSATQHKRVWHDVTNVDQIRVHMLWHDGREAEFFQSDIAALRKPKYFIQGTSGTLIGIYRPIVEETVSLPFGYEAREYHHAEAPATLKLSRYESDCGLIEESLPLAKAQHLAFHRNVADHLLLGEPLAVEPESVAGVIAILQAAQISGTTGSHYVSLSEV
ncbi:MAG: Gfo/Idh/MocA family oxidoreductase [Actinomycetota bacterium]|nr:MAG: Gfo/Idh/MocA family oxidoreductase [Actinomycetota bacterium]